MPTLYSDQLARQQAAGNQKSNGLTELGKVRFAFFDFVTTGAAQNDTVNLVILPKGARLLGGRLIGEALGTSVTLSLGTTVALTDAVGTGAIAAGAANLLAATSYASAADNEFAKTFALGAGATLDAEGTVYATIGGATPTTAKKVCGWVLYAQN